MDFCSQSDNLEFMPTYCFSSPTGETVERFFPMGDAPQAIQVDGQEAKRDYRAECVAVPATRGWPLVCYASGVHPKQAQELRDGLRRAGVATEVDRNGDPIYTSAVHRKKALAAREMHDNASFN